MEAEHSLVPTTGLHAMTPMAPAEIRERIRLVREIISQVLVKGNPEEPGDGDYGDFPGSKKPILHKQGAETLAFAFHLHPMYETDYEDLGGDHRSYRVTCTLLGPDNTVVGQGLGNCSTMESKYRYRQENTGRPVPDEYWSSRDPELLGGLGFSAQKRNKNWVIVHRIEYADPADYWHTCEQMAAKRGFVAATRATTGCSGILGGDTDDVDDSGRPLHQDGGEGASTPRPPPSTPQRRSEAAQGASRPAADGERVVTPAQRGMLIGKCKDAGIGEDAWHDYLRSVFGVESGQSIPFDRCDEVIAWINSYTAPPAEAPAPPSEAPETAAEESAPTGEAAADGSVGPGGVPF